MLFALFDYLMLFGTYKMYRAVASKLSKILKDTTLSAVPLFRKRPGMRSPQVITNHLNQLHQTP